MHARRQLAAVEARSSVKPVTFAESCNNGLQSLRQLPITLSRQPPAHGHEAIGSMDYDSTNNVFFHISDCELVEASQLVEELECSYWSDVACFSQPDCGGFFEGFW